MRTKVAGGTIVAFDGRQHRLLHDGVIVFENNQIVHVGRTYDGPSDHVIDARGRGRLVTPGFVNTHAHAGIGAGFKLITDAGRRDLFGAGYLNYSVPARGRSVSVRDDAELAARQYVVELLRSGTTTVVDAGSLLDVAEAVVRAAGELGLRVYEGPGFSAGRYSYDDDGVLDWHLDEQGGLRALEEAVAFTRRHDGSYAGRVRGALIPLQVDTSTPAFLRAIAQASDELNVPRQIHASQHLVEFQRVLRTTGRTPVELLSECGFLGPRAILGHCMITSDHAWSAVSGGNDLGLVADSGTSVSHSPHLYARRGMPMVAFGAYQRRGVNVTIGTDNRPFDMIGEMRLASYASKILDGSVASGSAADVFSAATLAGARALGRSDLGRLAPGASADLVIFDLDKPRIGVIRDPIRSLIESGTTDDVDTVIIIDGRIVVQHGQVPGVDEKQLVAAMQASSELYWAAFPEWDYAGRSADEAFPPAFPAWSDV